MLLLFPVGCMQFDHQIRKAVAMVRTLSISLYLELYRSPDARLRFEKLGLAGDIEKC